jgi:hypothetical protein
MALKYDHGRFPILRIRRPYDNHIPRIILPGLEPVIDGDLEDMI